MPHHSGEGHLVAGKPIVIDIFPRSQENGYFGDMTRTVVKGEPSHELERMYQTVLKGQKLGINLIRGGVKAKDVHGAIMDFFRKNGFETGSIDGKQQGFIHSTGHGLGLEIHEPPRVSFGEDVLEEGNVVTVEPGLYYEKLGGVRIEDVVVVKKDECINLSRYPKRFRV
jgi:Xaa-Pro aminopeptidase